jgi:hypothetical protein
MENDNKFYLVCFSTGGGRCGFSGNVIYSKLDSYVTTQTPHQIDKAHLTLGVGTTSTFKYWEISEDVYNELKTKLNPPPQLLNR